MLWDDEEEVKKSLTPWSYSLFTSLPDFMKKQILTEREISGSVQVSKLETEKLIAYLVDIELKNREKKKKYKGGFAPVTHYFGY